MKAIVVEESGGNEVLKYRSDCLSPSVESLQPGQMLVKNKYAGINFIDIYQRRGIYPISYPFIPGREGAGEIVAIGPQVEDFAVGDQVAYLASDSYAEFVVVSSTLTLRLPSGMELETAAALLLQGLTAVYLTHRTFKVKAGDFVLVAAAAGGTGGLITQICKNIGAIVIGLVSTKEKADKFKFYGGDHVIIYTKEDVPSRVGEITGGKGVQVVYDGVSGNTFDIFLACLAKFGYFVSFGNAGGKVDSIDPFKLSPKCIYYIRPTLFGYLGDRKSFLDRKLYQC